MLHISGTPGSPIWTMADGDDEHPIGLRLDCGDGGVVYMNEEQALETAEALTYIVKELRKDVP